MAGLNEAKQLLEDQV